MDGYDPSSYGDEIADLYDSLHDSDPGRSVETLARLAAGGSVLELGIGTGRIALPLAARGIEVEGLDASPAMVEKLQMKPGGGALKVILGDFADFDLGRTFRLIFVAFNTFFALKDQKEQASCLAAVARHLPDDGAFVMEAFVPDLSRFDRNQRVDVADVGRDRVVLNVSRHDPVSQSVSSQHVVISESGIRLVPIVIRYAYPPELDLMAGEAGLGLVERWGDWDGSPFTAESTRHVSVYRPR